MIDENFTDEEIIDKLEKFLKENPNLYDDEELRIIRRSILWGKKGSLTYENIRQVSDELGIVDENTNIYTGFAKLINEKWLFCFICLSALIASKIGAFVQRFVGHLYFVGM